MPLPEVCHKCRKLKAHDLVRRFKVPGAYRKFAYICAACDARRDENIIDKGRDRRASPDEQEARRALLELAVPFKQEFPLGPFFYDFARPDLALLIEVDSASHHAKAWQRGRDAAKTKYAEAAGWKLVRVRRPDVFGQVQALVARRDSELDPSTHRSDDL